MPITSANKGTITTTEKSATCVTMLGNIRKHSFIAHAAAYAKPKAPKKKRSYQESTEQRAVVKWLRARENWLVLRIENAAMRTPAQASRDAALGMEPGAPDLFVMFRTALVFVEMKSKTGSVSEEQHKLHAQLRARGVRVIVGYGAEETIAWLTNFELSVKS